MKPDLRCLFLEMDKDIQLMSSDKKGFLVHSFLLNYYYWPELKLEKVKNNLTATLALPSKLPCPKKTTVVYRSVISSILGVEQAWTPNIYLKSFDMDSVQVWKAVFVKESYTTSASVKVLN